MFLRPLTMQNFLDNLLNKITDPIFVKDQDSRLLMVNDAFCEIFGMEREQVLGLTLAEHVPEDERDHFLKVEREVIATGKESNIRETLTLNGNDSLYHHEEIALHRR